VTDWKGGEFPFLCLLLAVSTASFLFLMVQQIRDLCFYWRNHWDFSQDNNISLSRYYRGESSDEDLMSNKERILLGRPILIFVAAIFSIAFASIVFQPEHWRRSGAELSYLSLGSPQTDAH
jgi:hypothetical protein